MSTSSTPAYQARYKLIFFTPPQYLPQLKSAIFATGAGSYSNYSQCCFTTPGIGQFKPGDKANPTIGTPGTVEEVGEVRCEILCSREEVMTEAIVALKKAHPYEEPAYEVYKVEPF